jgi:capsular exopolysaccharide synthesis family protein
MKSGSLVRAREGYAIQERLPLPPPRKQSVRYEVDFAEAWRILRKRKYITFILLGLALGTVGLLALIMPKRYDAVARIDIDLTTMMPTLEENSSPSVAGTSEDPSTRLTSQVEILKTDAVAWDAIKKLRLDEKASFTADVLSRFTGKTGVSEPGTDLDRISPLRRHELLDRFQHRLTVKLVPKTEILEIHFRDRDPALAAQVANMVADNYINVSLRHRYTTTMQASAWLTGQLADLKQNVEDTESAFARYKQEKGIILTHQTAGNAGADSGSREGASSNLVLDKLEETNQQLAGASADRIVKEARWRTAQSHDPELITNMTPNENGPRATLMALRSKQTELNAELARQTASYGDKYPTVVQLRKQLSEVESSINREMERITKLYQDDYDIAASNERMLQQSIEQQKQQAFRFDQDAIRLAVLKKDAEASRDTYDDVLKKLKVAGVLAGLKATNLTVVDPAEVPAHPAEPRIPLMLAIALFGGLIASIGGSFAAEALDNTVRTPEDVENLCGMPSLGIVPAFTGALRGRGRGSKNALPELLGSPNSQAAEAYRCMRTALLLAAPDSPPKLLIVTSGLPKEGKTTTSLNAAIVMAQKGSRVLLVDGDLRRPSIHHRLGLKMNGGLSGALTYGDFKENILKIEGVPSLDILVAGARPANPAELLDSTRMRDLLNTWKAQYDHVIIDCPPLLGMADSAIMATMADGVVLVARSGVSRYQTLRRMRDTLASLNVQVAGVLVNGVDTNSESHYSYYGYYGKNYNSYYLGNKKEGAKAR